MMGDEAQVHSINPPSESELNAASAPATLVGGASRIVRREPYDGPATGRAWQRTSTHKGRQEREVRVTIDAVAPGEGAQIGDLWLVVTPERDGHIAGVPMRFRLDVGAKRFLFSQLEQALTIGDFSRGV